MTFDESLHPRVTSGAGGGEFTSGGSGGASAKAPAKKTTAAAKPAHPHGSLAFDGHTGPGYGEKNGDKRVHSLQEALNRLGFTDSAGHKLLDDGKLGPRTTAAVKKAQHALGLKADGVVTPALLKQLSSAKSVAVLKADAKKTAAPAKKAGGATATLRTPPEKHVAPHSTTTRHSEVAMTHETLTPEMFRRSYELDNIEIVSRANGGDGRTVEAYAAVFGVRKEIHDQHGDYIEENDPAMFNRTINNGAVKRAIVLYNHGFDARGKSGGLPTVPLGRPVEIKADKRGLLTVSRYNNSEFADTVLESIKNGDIRAQSYEGPIYRSTPERVPKVRRGAQLPVVRRMEMGLRNYGPTPTPYFEEAEITAVRSAVELAEEVARLDTEQRDELIRALSTTPGWDPETAHILATPHRGPGAEDSRETHSVRQKLIRLKADLRERNL